MNGYQVIKITEKAASEFMEKHEAMGNIGLGVWHYGLLENDNLLSVVSYGTPCFSVKRTLIGKISKKFGCKIIQLCRGGTVISSPKNIASQLIANANQMLYKENGNLIIVAYADPEFGEVGAVYQAANAIYLGQTNPKNQSNYIVKGVWLSGWDVRKKYGTRNFDKLKKIDSSVKKFPLTPKYRYLFIKTVSTLTNKIHRAFSDYRLPYPKKITENLRKLASNG